ncbi:efflux RND transporter periplasmic adaptor subunit [Myroides pelagicus]|uniref:efflux RND transporter periplasmic adaptor subunit n=1 Tax=Myroides pelagicus TaxID=270914 RepID=UPI002DB80F6C|nr:efflux RND transporter periplasmic adaptor subunit [Myroides pelagicus]MEC4114194.1 efflux RND transporter periplasmic adaptor subunit [Myroides pelagicus]
METIKNIFRNNLVKYSSVLLVGLLLGWLVFGSAATHQHNGDEAPTTQAATVWTCSMHPQIKMDKPGKCPLCAMDLIPLKATDSGDDVIDDNAIQMSKQAIALANIQTTRVSSEEPIKDIQLYGTIQVDERLQQSQTSHVNGRIERLYVNFTGESVRQGQLIASIYSPDLLTAQQELLEAVKLKDFQPLLVDAAKEKLRLWKMSDSQINNILSSKKVSPYVNVYANTSGIVVAKNVNEGDYISQGTVLYSVSNLSKVWAVFDAYEQDLPFLKVGDQLSYTLQSLPGEIYTGKISFINPIIDATTRTAKVRVETNNKDQKLKPEMYANARVKAPMKQYNNEIIIPKSAVLWTGKRSIIYVKQPNTTTPAFKLREVELGPSLGDSYVVMTGLNSGEEIVTNGVFTVDASAQLEGKTSMMNNDGAGAVTGHAGHADHNTTTQAKADHAMFKVSGNCGLCKERIEDAAKTVAGVLSVDWVVDTKELHLNYDKKKTTKQAVSQAIAKVGHDTEFHKATEKDYVNLHSCCQYERL